MLRVYRLIVCFSILSTVINTVNSQSNWVEWKEFANDDRSVAAWEEKNLELAELAEHPFNINTITKEQLELLPFLSDRLIENILYYLYKYGPMVSKNELLGIEGMDYQTRRFLNDFIYIGSSSKEHQKFSFKRMMKYNKQDLLIRVDIPFNQKAGYADYSKAKKTGSEKNYLGNAYYQNLRYKFQYKNQVYWGFVAEKDAGEPFFSKCNKKGYDFYSAYFFIQNMKRVKNLAIGNYRASFGYGMLMNMGFSMGKSNSSAGSSRLGRGISKYTSTNEYNYLRGFAVTYCLSKRWEASVFYSYRKMDANVDNQFIKTLKTDGLHRLKMDLEKKNTICNNLIGSNLSYNGKYFKGGITSVYNFFNKVLNPDFHLYNAYYPRGRYFFNNGIYGKYFRKDFIIAGEVGIDKKGNFAVVQSISYSPEVNTMLTVINRYYDKKYQALYANGFGENSRVQNEIGTYIGLETTILHRFKLLTYIDLFYFPWYRYRVDKQKTFGVDGLLQIGYSPSYSLSMFIKYNYKSKPQNYLLPSKQKLILPKIRHRLHYQLEYSWNEQTKLKTFVEGIFTAHWKQNHSNGYQLGSTAKWGRERFPLKGSITGAWFDTKDYDSRIYLYEPGLLYSFSMYSYYGKGTRLAVNLSCSLGKKLVLQGKWGWTHYLDRKSIGTGREEIMGSNKSDLQLQLKIKW